MHNTLSKVVGILLAAGSSSRFGSNKCLALLPDQTAMGIRSAQNLCAYVDEMIVVIPPDNAAVEALFSKEGYATIICQTAGLGMSESLKVGVGYFDKEQPLQSAGCHAATAFVIALADMPLIKPETYHSVISELKHDASILSPQHQGRRGHPVGFNAKYRKQLLSLSGDEGAKLLLQKYAKDTTLIDVNDPGIHQDFDTRSLFEQYFNERTA